MSYIKNAELAMMEELHGIAQKHEGSHPMLVTLDIDPEKYPGQRMTHTSINGEGKVLDPDIGATIANDIDTRFPALENVFAETYEESDGINRLIELLKGGNNVINGTDHAELIDIALSHLALSYTIKRADIPHRSGLIVSKMVDFLGVKLGDEPTPARELFELGFDRTYLTIPRTLSTDGKFNEQHMKLYNKAASLNVTHDMERHRAIGKKQKSAPPMLIGVALPGTVNKELAGDRHKTKVIGRVSEGILKFTGIEKTETIATAIRLEEENPRFFIDNLPMRVTDKEDIPRLMGRLITGIETIDGGVYTYDEDGNLPVVQ